MAETEIIQRLRLRLSPKRLMHSIGAADAASKLAEIYAADIVKCRLASLLHDCAKEIPADELILYAAKYGLRLDDVSIKETVLLHGPLGAKFAEYEYGIEDKEILNAIDCHTTGKENMTLIEKIVYLADLIERGRNFEEVEAIRNLSNENIDKALLFALNRTITKLVINGRLIHQRTVEARNYLLVELAAKKSTD